MNYTSARYDGPYGYSVNSDESGRENNGGYSNHSASSSLSSTIGKDPSNLNGNGYMDTVTNMAGVGAHHHALGGNSAMVHPSSSRDFDRPGTASASAGGSPASGNTTLTPGAGAAVSRGLPRSRMGAVGGGASHIGVGAPSQSQQYMLQHRRGRPSDGDYDSPPTSQGYNVHPGFASSASYFAGNGFDEAAGNPDSAFDFLLSPGLAPVGPISSAGTTSSILPSSSSSSFASLASAPSNPSIPASSHLHNVASASDLQSLNAAPNRPNLPRSQTTGVAPSSARPYGTSQSLQTQQQHPPRNQTTSNENISTSNTSSIPQGAPSSASGSGSATTAHQAPPPAISPGALLEVILRMRNGDATGSSAMTHPSSSAMGRSQSASAVQTLNNLTHARNTSTGSNASEGEQQQQQQQGGSNSQQSASLLQAPSHTVMQRTASNRNVSASGGHTGLETVDLSHQRVAEVPEEVIDVLTGTVERLALSYNYITTLPPAFAKLGTTLRYLNIRLNMLTTFPAVLCEMPSLEILDISRNKIKRLPSNCGTLKSLRVFSISKNRVKRLPAYFADMNMLRVLKIDHNPLEWPPREVVTQPTITAGSGRKEGEVSKMDEAHALQKWLSELQNWIREHASEVPGQILASSRSEEALSSEAARRRRAPSDARAVLSPAAPPTPSAEPSPPDSKQQERESNTRPSHTNLPALETDSSRLSQHGRNASHSIASGALANRRTLRPKKSLPDLRQNHAQILDERFNDEEAQGDGQDVQGRFEMGPPSVLQSRHTKNASSSSISPVTARPKLQLPTPPHSAASTPSRNAGVALANPGQLSPSFRPDPPSSQLPPARLRRPLNGLNNNHDKPSFDRASGAYFRRLSMLPPSTISKAVPDSLLHFIDGIRGILFSLSQIYSSLKQCVVFPARDRLPQALTKIMASADDAMGFLIDALDRFDSSTRRGTPDVLVVKDVVETCRENVSTFAKLVTCLSGHSGMLFTQDSDTRYTRTMVLALYGSIGEIGMAWSALTPLRNEIIAWIRGEELEEEQSGPSPVSFDPRQATLQVEDGDDDSSSRDVEKARRRRGGWESYSNLSRA